MIVLRDDLMAVLDAIRLARATFATIRRNLAWAFCYNLLALPLAAARFLNPLIAAATMTLSSVFVVCGGMWLEHVGNRVGNRVEWSWSPADGGSTLSPRTRRSIPTWRINGFSRLGCRGTSA
jgi:hypothetical protein